MYDVKLIHCHPCCRNADQRAKTRWVLTTWHRNACTATAWAAVSMGTCHPPVMRTSRQELREVLLCREGFLCLSRIPHQRWTWPRRLPSPLSPSTPPLSRPPIYQRPTTSHAKRSTPKKLGRARNPPLHCSSDQFRNTADSQVTSRYIRDCDLADVELITSHFIFYLLRYSPSSRKGHTRCPFGLPQDIISVTKQQLISQPEKSRIVSTAN